MDKTVCVCEMCIHLVDGMGYTFVQSDPQANQKILERFDPHKLFIQPYFSIESAQGVTIFPCARITCLELRVDPDPGWQMGAHSPEAKLREVSPADYERILSSAEGAALTRRERKPGEAFHGFTKILLADHKEVVVEIQTKVAIVPDQKMMLEWLLGMKTIFFPRAAGGYVFINPANVLRLEIRPGQPNIAPLAWRAEPLPVPDPD